MESGFGLQKLCLGANAQGVGCKMRSGVACCHLSYHILSEAAGDVLQDMEDRCHPTVDPIEGAVQACPPLPQ